MLSSLIHPHYSKIPSSELPKELIKLLNFLVLFGKLKEHKELKLPAHACNMKRKLNGKMKSSEKN